MKFSYNWLKEFIDLRKISPEQLAEVITSKSFEVKNINKIDGDSVFNVDILPNRAHDCLSHKGLAIEIAALFGLQFKELKFKVRESSQKINKFLNIEIKEPEVCNRYMSRFLFDVKVKSSPKWLVKKLEACGQRSINNVVDVLNYVMLETGQPLHAFDYNKLFSTGKVKKIIVRKARDNEEMTTLDGVFLKLNPNVLVISDERQSLAVAGIKGGKVPEVDKDTTKIVLESANFNFANIRQASKLLKLKTEASVRFEAGLDPNLAEEAMERASSLLIEVAGAKTAKGKLDFYPKKLVSKKVSLALERISRFLGVEIPKEKVEEIFKNLGFGFEMISLQKELISNAKKLLGRPYKYGVSTALDAPKLFDCSSFTRYLFRLVGIEIPRPSIDQYLFSEKIDSKELAAGDLVFFIGSKPHSLPGIKEQVGHVGLYIGDGEIIHADGDLKKVVKEKLEAVSKRKNFVGAGRILKHFGESILVTVPTIRMDIENDNDLLEELIRICGYENLLSLSPKISLMPKVQNEFLKFTDIIRNLMPANGFSEVYNYSFFGDREKELYGIKNKSLIELENPINLQLKFLRTSLLPNIIRNVKENLKNYNSVKIFEIGDIFNRVGNLVAEKNVISGAISYKIKKGLTKEKFIEGEEYFELKGITDLILQKLGYSDYYFDNFEPKDSISDLNIWHPLRSADIRVRDQNVGFAGEVNPQILAQLDVKNRVAIFELDLEKLFELFEAEKDYQPILKYPAVIRDLSILVPVGTMVDDVLNKIENASPLIYDADLFDIYEGEELPEGKKSLAFKIIYQSDSKTLSDEEVGKIQGKLIKILEEDPEWEVRK